jgi:hypothetical protein
MSSDPLPAQSPSTTLGSLLADAASLAEGARALMLAAESGRHPTLQALRGALGDDLDLDTPIAAGRIALGSGAPDDAHIEAALDAAYRALGSPRIVRATIDGGRISASREPSPIAVREDEPLVLLVLGDNRTDATVEFSAESHGEGFGGFVEARRTGSSLLGLGALPPGKYLVPLMLVADGTPTTIDLPIECAAS